ncbi:MAG: hypothetical protein M4579_000578 [Chaenotheca gracillima]|nr:MAG: hypothetical protein M4579_000578 [Chaenotheca gracillima]
MKFNTAVLATIAAALSPAMVAAQFDDANAVLGPDPNGTCSWKIALICAGSLVGCGATCGAAAVEASVNPFADAGCVACVGTTAGICAQCWGSNVNGGNEVCVAAETYPGQAVPEACPPLSGGSVS